MADFVMPSLGADMEAGKLVQWLVKTGDKVTKGDAVAVVDTEKAAVEVEVFATGVVEEILVHEGDKVPVGTVMAKIRTEGEPAVVAASAPPPPTPPAVQAGRRKVSPAARKRGAELGVDVEALEGTGPEGAVTTADVERAATKVGHAEPVDKRQAMRRAIAAAMSRSKREIPHYYLGTRIDMRPALTWLAAQNLKRPVQDRLLPAVLLLKAVALGLKDVPELNGFFVDGRFQPSKDIHLGVAISLREGGLVAPALHDAGTKSLDDLMRDFRDLVTRARNGVLRSSEMSDPTITVTNLGDLGVETVFGVIFPPQVALVGFGRVADQPWLDGGAVVARPAVTATLAADHRVSDGHRGGRFLAKLDELLAHPEGL